MKKLLLTLTYNFNIGSDSASLDIVDADGETTASTETALESSNVYSFVDAAGETHEISDDDVIAGVVGEDGYVYTYTVTAAADEGSAPTVTAVRAEAQISYVITEDEDAEATTSLQDADGNDITTDTVTVYSAEIDGNVVTGTASEILSAVIAAEMTDGTIEITRTSDPITVDIDYTWDFHIQGGSITHNTATVCGGGVYVFTYNGPERGYNGRGVKFTMHEDVKVHDNTAKIGGA